MVYAKGKRMNVYKIFNFIIKIKKKESKAVSSIKNEGIWLKKLNKCGIGPKLYYYNDKFIICKFVKGDRILDYFKKVDLNKKKNVVREVLRQCRILDKLKVDKFEMHHPLKHIIVGRKIVLIDFERCKYSERPKNVTGFCQFLNNYYKKVDSDKLKEVLKKYKESYSEEDFDEIVGLFC
ncbi:hypothetical protein HYV88_05785 [Candidatus Woesearchaeota archaeon]|nr:hypothetical protein [Candidatus Woesearchaeota archaeon]